MPNYCVNKIAQSDTGDHEVHDLSMGRNCLPVVANRLDLGWPPDCASAVRKAKTYYAQVDGCFYCAKACHKS